MGLATNVQFLRHVVQSDAFSQAQLDTALIQREEAVLFGQERVGLPLGRRRRRGQPVAASRPRQGANPFSRTRRLAFAGRVPPRFEFDFKAAHAKAWLTYERDGGYQLTVEEGEGAAQGRLPLHAPGGRPGPAIRRPAHPRNGLRPGRERPYLHPPRRHAHRGTGPARPMRVKPPARAAA